MHVHDTSGFIYLFYMVSMLTASLTLQSRVVTIYNTFSNILKLCILPTECICVFRIILTLFPYTALTGRSF
jgi:succinate dehydrogenase/fumarate reductase cytochrome b subunit